MLFGIAVALLSACVGSNDTPDPGSSPAPTSPESGAVEISAIDNTFEPEAATVNAGTPIVWTNDGRNDHNILPADGGSGWGLATEEFGPGDEYRFAFEEAGTYPYYCSLHGTADAGMTGVVEVLE